MRRNSLKGKKTSEEPVLGLLVSRLESFERSITAMDEKVDQLVITTAKQEENVKEHMRRSDALEKRQDIHEASAKAALELLRKEMEPVKDHVKWVGITLKVIGALGGSALAILGIVEAYIKIMQLLGK
jgi:hypothetical protein